MAVEYIQTGSVLGGLTRKDNGDVTCSCRAQGNSDTTSVVLELSYNSSFSPLIPGTYTAGATNSGNNYVATAYFTGKIQEGRQVFWRSRLEGVSGPIFGTSPLNSGSFIAPGSITRNSPYRISFLGCTQVHDASANANLRNYNVALARRINSLAGDYLCHFGDTWYPENSSTTGTYADYVIGEWFLMNNSSLPADITVPRMRTDVMTMLASTNVKHNLGYSMAHLYASRPFYGLPDDHEFVQPAGEGYPPPGGSVGEKGRQVGYQVYGEYFGNLNKELVQQDGNTFSNDWLNPVYYHRFNNYPVEFIYPDFRGYQNVLATDNASKTLATQITNAQKDWFETRLRNSVAPFLVIISTIELDGKHGYNLTNTPGDNWLAATHARDEMLELIWTIRGYRPVVFVTGDTHNQAVTIYEGKTGRRPTIWSFCASHGAASSGHEQTIGWMGRILGLAAFEAQGVTGWGAKPILNIGSGGSNVFNNNLLTIDIGQDNKGFFLKPTIWQTWPTSSIISSVPPYPLFSHEFRA